MTNLNDIKVSALPQFKNKIRSRCQWLTPVILATTEAEIRSMEVQWASSSRDPISKKPITKTGLVE
jgi:hypothetical protein